MQYNVGDFSIHSGINLDVGSAHTPIYEIFTKVKGDNEDNSPFLFIVHPDYCCILYVVVYQKQNDMPDLPKPRRNKRPRNKVAFKQDGTPDRAKTTAFYSANTDHHKLYDTQAWRRLSKRVLREDPVCPLCLMEGRMTAATETDHIIAHKGDKALFYDRANLVGFCKQCHARKTAAERNGKWYETLQEWLAHLIRR